ncbi:unnamed protein product [Hermetia illucens]|uniref:Uncharacterized protein n=1 Tax=Hermetia illucens TaxID=343691 RepID=A0A7R8UFV4_HERIL|nr:uncharacterized protein LOC119661415 [Hermetia illucens]CAD7079930.1 unnamed protein product [Hermetia illucens]
MFWVLAVLLFVTGGRANKCTLSYEPSYPAIFTQKIGSNNIILSARGGQLSWDDRTTVNAYCPGGFRHLALKNPHNYEDNFDYDTVGNRVYHQSPDMSHLKNIVLSCQDVQMKFEGSEIQNDGQLSCSTTSKYYETVVPACKYRGLAYGFFVGEQAVVLAEVCYQLDLLQPTFLHYAAGDRSTILEHQSTQNVANLTTGSVEVLIDDSNLEVEMQSLLEAVQESIPEYATVVQYKLDEFIPLKESLGVFGSYTNDFRSLNMIPWWTPLKLGNWKSIEEAIETISRNETYDIFAGISGVVIYPNNDKCLSTGTLTYKAVPYVRNVPKYIWNYIRKRKYPDEGVVVIGVNTPFVDNSKGDYIICQDICDSISWLNSMKMTRKMAGLGYIFCCKPAEVKDKLDNFPIF